MDQALSMMMLYDEDQVLFTKSSESVLEKLKEAVRVSQEKAEYRIQILQEIVSNTKSEFRVFIKEVFKKQCFYQLSRTN